jgi:hypothetical protein
VSKLRYSLLSPRAPRRYAGYLVGLVVAAGSVTVVGVAGVVGPIVTHAAFSGLVAVTL